MLQNKWTMALYAATGTLKMLFVFSAALGLQRLTNSQNARTQFRLLNFVDIFVRAEVVWISFLPVGCDVFFLA